MTHVVQFTCMTDFIADLAAGKTAAIYHALVEQRIMTDGMGLTRWTRCTIIRAIVANGRVTHLAALTIPLGEFILRANGRVLVPPGAEAEDEQKWRQAQETHKAVVDHLEWMLAERGLLSLFRAGILNLPDDPQILFGDNPLNPREEVSGLEG